MGFLSLFRASKCDSRKVCSGHGEAKEVAGEGQPVTVHGEL
eukprot:gene10421-3659_t